MQIQTSPAWTAPWPPAAPAFRHIFRLIADMPLTLGAAQTSVLCAAVSAEFHKLAQRAADGCRETLAWMASRDLTIADYDAASDFLSRRARELHIGGLH